MGQNAYLFLLGQTPHLYAFQLEWLSHSTDMSYKDPNRSIKWALRHFSGQGYGVVISGMVLDPSEDETHLAVVERVSQDLLYTVTGVCSKIRVEPFRDSSLITQDSDSLYTCASFLTCIVLLVTSATQRTG